MLAQLCVETEQDQQPTASARAELRAEMGSDYPGSCEQECEQGTAENRKAVTRQLQDTSGEPHPLISQPAAPPEHRGCPEAEEEETNLPRGATRDPPPCPPKGQQVTPRALGKCRHCCCTSPAPTLMARTAAERSDAPPATIQAGAVRKMLRIRHSTGMKGGR